MPTPFSEPNVDHKDSIIECFIDDIEAEMALKMFSLGLLKAAYEINHGDRDVTDPIPMAFTEIAQLTFRIQAMELAKTRLQCELDQRLANSTGDVDENGWGEDDTCPEFLFLDTDDGEGGGPRPNPFHPNNHTKEVEVLQDAGYHTTLRLYLLDVDGVEHNVLIETIEPDGLLIGGVNSDDYLASEAGIHLVEGLGGDDQIVFDHQDYMFGGDGFDTIIFDNEDIDTSFNAAANGFEQVRHIVGNETNDYNLAGGLVKNIIETGPGDRIETLYDADGVQTYATLETTFVGDQIRFRDYDRDDGTSQHFSYDLDGSASWHTLQTDRDVNNAITLRRYLNDDGTRFDFRYDAGDEFSWDVLRTDYDANTEVVLRRYSYDEGQRTDFSYDPYDQKAWSEIQNFYTPGNALDLTRYFWDNGERTDYNYDQDDEFSWDLRTTTYDAAGNVISDVFA